MKILFLGRHYTYFRNFESVLRELAERGHVVHAAVERDETFGGRQLMDDLAARYPNITYGEAPARPSDDEWGWIAGWLRLGLDFVRYQHPLFDEAPRLRARARDRTPGLFVTLGRLPGLGGWSRRLQATSLRRLERVVPDDPGVRDYVERMRPDLVLITPLIDLGSSQIDYLRTARALGIPTALCVWSWDHLSSKALIRECPDRVLLWNETQRREAVELHGVPASRIVVTGAQCFDQWFNRQPSRDRVTFMRQVALPDDRPLVLYVCSALFSGSPIEAGFVVEWIRGLRASGRRHLSDAAILVRPHPSRLTEWEQVDLGGLGPVVVWGSNPVDAQARADYFDSLYHADAVVGLNTSAFIEAGIVGRQVMTVLLPEFHDNQMGTLHFRYLRSVGGGLLTVAESLAEHAQQLDDALVAPRREVAPFVREFVRPLGLEVRATTVFADAVDAMRGLVPEPVPVDPLAPRLRGLLLALGRAHRRGRFERWLLSSRERASVEQLRNAADSKRERRLGLVREREARHARQQAEDARRAAEAAAGRAEDDRERARNRAEREARRQADEADRRRRREADQTAKAARVAERIERKRRHTERKRTSKRHGRGMHAVGRRLQAACRRLFGSTTGCDER